jgi:hypothetical protein
MALLVVIALGQLAVLFLILSLLTRVIEERANQQQVAEQAVRTMEHQTIEALFAASRAGAVNDRSPGDAA